MISVKDILYLPNRKKFSNQIWAEFSFLVYFWPKFNIVLRFTKYYVKNPQKFGVSYLFIETFISILKKYEINKLWNIV